jgi:hypothetical protein
MFRANPQHTGDYDTTAVHQFSKIKWQLETELAIESSPAVVDGTVYLGTFDGLDAVR